MLNEIQVDGIGFTPTDLKILDARITKNALIQFHKAGLRPEMSKVLSRVVAITGGKLPENENERLTLTIELIEFLIEFGYKLLNEDEIILGFQLNAAGDIKSSDGTPIPEIKLFGEYLNVHYFAKVLSNYMILRIQFDRKLQNFIDGY